MERMDVKRAPVKAINFVVDDLKTRRPKKEMEKVVEKGMLVKSLKRTDAHCIRRLWLQIQPTSLAEKTFQNDKNICRHSWNKLMIKNRITQEVIFSLLFV